MNKSLTFKIIKTWKKIYDKVKTTCGKFSHIVFLIIIFFIPVILLGNIGFFISIILFQFIINQSDIFENYIRKDEHRMLMKKSDDFYEVIEEDHRTLIKENQELKHKLEKAIYKIGCQKKELRKLNKNNGAKK